MVLESDTTPEVAGAHDAEVEVVRESVHEQVLVPGPDWFVVQLEGGQLVCRLDPRIEGFRLPERFRCERVQRQGREHEA